MRSRPKPCGSAKAARSAHVGHCGPTALDSFNAQVNGLGPRASMLHSPTWCMCAHVRSRSCDAGGGGPRLCANQARSSTWSRFASLDLLETIRISACSPQRSPSSPLGFFGRLRIVLVRFVVACLFLSWVAVVLMREPSCVQSCMFPSRAQPGLSATVLSQGTLVTYACVSSCVVLVSDVRLVQWAPACL